MSSEIRQINIAQNQQRIQSSAARDMHGRNLIVSGEFVMTDVGEAMVTIRFPITFTEKPLFSFGGDVQENQPIPAGYMPTISGIVVRYQEERDGLYRTFWKGADVGVVVTGQPGQMTSFHWHFMGKGIFNPIISAQDVDGAI